MRTRHRPPALFREAELAKTTGRLTTFQWRKRAPRREGATVHSQHISSRDKSAYQPPLPCLCLFCGMPLAGKIDQFQRVEIDGHPYLAHAVCAEGKDDEPELDTTEGSGDQGGVPEPDAPR